MTPSGPKMVVHEGLRSALPKRMCRRGWRHITIPMEFEIPPTPGRYLLKILLLHEYVRWAEESASVLEVEVVAEGGGREENSRYSTREELPVWSEQEDSRIGIEMMAKQLREGGLGSVKTVMEVGRCGLAGMSTVDGECVARAESGMRRY